MRVPGGFGATQIDSFRFRLLPLGVMFALAIVGLASGPIWSERWAAWPWLVSLVCVGLPHGAADLAVARRRLGPRELMRAASGYLMILVATLGGLIAAPALVLPAFVILSVWHFGVARGGFAIGIPLAAWPEATGRVAAEVAAVVGYDAAFPIVAIRWLGIAIFAAAVAATAREVARGCRRTDWRTAAAALTEATVITLLAATTDPLFSVGVFFLCWHAWREMPQLAAEIGVPGPVDGHTIARIHVAALPLLVPTWLALGAAWWLLPEPHVSHSLRGLAILSVAAYVVVTPAHTTAVSEGVKIRADRSSRRPARAAFLPQEAVLHER